MLINLTPHPVVFGDGRELPKCESPPRLAEKQEPIGMIDGIPIIRKAFDLGGCNLPEPVPGTYYIVPLLIAQVFSDRREDLLVTNEPIRDADGRIVGCRSVARV